eukprot:TRINITY_DN8144_c0_g1_i1.p1 TRINITY_DN8144_c0_g1~~TRINITY_DN8144_c0_g1_i1.p1  ORF type:complete len:243 (+),score=34.92 TRINITY_DN8144_c0_g1_i1:40-768(+)
MSSRTDEELLVENTRRFNKVGTLPAAILSVCLCLVQITLAFILPELCDKKGKECVLNSFSILIYTHGGHWAGILAVDQFLHLAHHKSRLSGYLEFYTKTKNIRRAPFYLVSAGNFVLMLIVIILHDLCDDDQTCSHTFTKVDYLRGLITLESLVVICCNVSYIIILREFNKKQSPPDVLREDFVTSIHLGDHGDTIGVQQQDQVMEVMERQAELIRYLKDHSETLGKKILDLTNQLALKERA